MRIVIDIDGDRVTIHRSDEALPPPELLERATALSAEAAGAAPIQGAGLSLGPLGEAALDAGAAPKPPSKARAAAASVRPRSRPKPRAR